VRVRGGYERPGGILTTWRLIGGSKFSGIQSPLSLQHKPGSGVCLLITFPRVERRNKFDLGEFANPECLMPLRGRMARGLASLRNFVIRPCLCLVTWSVQSWSSLLQNAYSSCPCAWSSRRYYCLLVRCARQFHQQFRTMFTLDSWST
jgi:hypothetical protein